MSSEAILVEDLSKRFRIPRSSNGRRSPEGGLRSALATLAERLSRPSLLFTTEFDEVWALRDVSLKVREGEVVGIIGPNGAGKSTLLKILSRITEPTKGRAVVRGRVASLLEVGTGFHPELTGRENVYLSGAILGMSKAEIDRKYEEIVAFSELEKFMDTPIKRYSSGMQVRLAFSVAAHLEPEILLIDEVLAVGDAEFQRRSLNKMREKVQGGRTVLFVSHNLGSVVSLCQRAILLDHGQILFDGPSREAVARYLASVDSSSALVREWDPQEAPAGLRAKVRGIKITDQHGVPKPYFSTSEPILVHVEYWALQQGVPINVGFRLFDGEGNWIWSVINFDDQGDGPAREPGLYRSTCIIPANLLNAGYYSITLELYSRRNELEVRVESCAKFQTVDDQRIGVGHVRWGGIIKPKLDWISTRLDGTNP